MSGAIRFIPRIFPQFTSVLSRAYYATKAGSSSLPMGSPSSGKELTKEEMEKVFDNYSFFQANPPIPEHKLQKLQMLQEAQIHAKHSEEAKELLLQMHETLNEMTKLHQQYQQKIQSLKQNIQPEQIIE